MTIGPLWQIAFDQLFTGTVLIQNCPDTGQFLLNLYQKCRDSK